MKIYLASFMQPENFGPGILYSICNGQKPLNINVEKQFSHVIPSPDLINRYAELRPTDGESASKMFITEYNMQLEKFVEQVLYAASQDNKSPQEILPFNEGDTLCSWERSQFTNYRKILAPYLEKLGYEVVLN